MEAPIYIIEDPPDNHTIRAIDVITLGNEISINPRERTEINRLCVESCAAVRNNYWPSSRPSEVSNVPPSAVLTVVGGGNTPRETENIKRGYGRVLYANVISHFTNGSSCFEDVNTGTEQRRVFLYYL